MRKLILFLIIISAFSCNKKNTISTTILKPYIISLENKKIKEELKKDKVPPPYIPVGVSGECNLILDKKNNIYYYQKEYLLRMCCTGLENDTLPKFLNLQPKDLIKIPKEYLEEFIDNNVMIKEKRRQILIIASQNDTIRNNSFLKFIKNTKIPTYIFRRTTQEEDTVLYYKKNNQSYFSDEIKWDKKRIKFNNVKFVKPTN